MPKLLSLEMQGFKSFANRTKITFPKGLVVIIGPNGSGKSNISDAICFVLGKRSKKEMRTEKLSHLIFNGGKSGKGAEFARVMLSLDNSKKEFPYDGKVFSVSRTVDKDGTSTYRINGKRCTLSEVENALRGANINPDGMNIIIQGEIAKFVDMSPNDKRGIIEDIAGISVYEDKKRKALSEVENVEARTKEGRIVLVEKKKYLDELKVEKDQAERYLRKKKELEGSKASLLLKQMKEVGSRVAKTDSDIESENRSMEKWRTKVKDGISKIKVLRDEVDALTKEIEESGEREQVELGKEVQKIQDRLSELKGLIKNHTEEMKRMSERESEIEKNISENQGLMEELRSRKRRFESRLEEINAEIRDNKVLLEGQNKSRYLVLKEQLIGAEKELFVKKGELEKYSGIEGKRARLEELKDDRVEKEKELSGLADSLESLVAKKTRYQNKLKEVEEYLSHLEMEAVRVGERGRSSTLDGAKKVCSAGIGGVYGILSELFKAKEHERAVLSFAGPMMDAVVVDNLETARKVSGLVREKGISELLVVVVSELNVKEVKAPKEGIPLIDCISFAERYRKLFEAVFSGYIVKSLKSSSECVTADGDSLKNGILRCGGGYENAEKSLSRIEKDSSRYRTYRNNLKEDLEQAGKDIEAVKIREVENRRDLKDISDGVRSIERSLGELKPGEMQVLNKDIAELENRIASVRKEMESCETVSEDLLAELKDGLKTLENEERDMEREIVSSESRIENVVARDLKQFENIKRSLEADMERFEGEIKDAREEMVVQERILLKKRAEFQNLYSKLRDRFSKRDDVKGKIAELEKSNALTEQRIEGTNKRMQGLKVRRAELLAQLEGLKERSKEYDDAKDVRKSTGELESDIRVLEREIAKFGPVNMKALETFREVEGEFNRLENKVKKLEDETAEIYRMIDEIESKKNQSFMGCFRNINRNFGKIFEALSPGGKAKLVLENPESPLEGGVDFVAKPFGKKLSSLKQLSGGEKTIVTLAFIFSIQEYESAPFYVFDEIDAALDKTNSEKLAELVDEYAKSAQFVIISHNDELVGSAEYLYGVSMRPSGVSQVVSIKLKE